MDVKAGSKYIFVIQIDQRVLTFTGEVISYKDGWLKFKDKFGEEVNYNQNSIISYKEAQA